MMRMTTRFKHGTQVMSGGEGIKVRLQGCIIINCSAADARTRWLIRSRTGRGCSRSKTARRLVVKMARLIHVQDSMTPSRHIWCSAGEGVDGDEKIRACLGEVTRSFRMPGLGKAILVLKIWCEKSNSCPSSASE